MCAHRCRCAAPLGAPSRRLTASGPRFRLGLPKVHTVSELLAGHPSVPGRSPAPPKRVTLRLATPAGAASVVTKEIRLFIKYQNHCSLEIILGAIVLFACMALILFLLN